MRLKVTRLAGAQEGQLGIGLSCGEARFTLAIDAARNDKHYTGLAFVSGRTVQKRADGRRGRIMHMGVPRQLTVVVRPGEVVLEVDGEKHYQWKGDLHNSTRDNSPTDEPLRIGGQFPGVFRFEEIWLEPIGDDSGRPLSQLP